MEHQAIVAVIEWVGGALEIVGVVVIALAFAHAIIRALIHFGQRRANAYERLKIYLGRSLLLGLEFLVAADIIRTVAIRPTKEGLLSLGLLIAVRIVLGWSIAVEIEGCWPWQVAVNERLKGRKSEGGEPAAAKE